MENTADISGNAITYVVTIISVDMYPSFGGMDNVIKSVNCNYTGSLETDTGTLTYSIPFCCELPPPTPGSFTPYSELTNNEVIGWINENANILFFQQIISNNLDKLKTPTVSVIPNFL